MVIGTLPWRPILAASIVIVFHELVAVKGHAPLEEQKLRRRHLLARRTRVFDTADTADNLLYANEHGATQVGSVPLDFSGLWWMDGNPQTNEFVSSFGQSNWKSVADDGYKCRNGPLLERPKADGQSYKCLGGLEIRVGADPRTWSFSNDFWGHAFVAFARVTRTSIHFDCGGDNGLLKYCSLSVTHDSNPVGWLADFTYASLGLQWDMSYVEDGLWYRDSFTESEEAPVNRYYLKRIVNGDGTLNEPYWSEYNSEGTMAPQSLEDKRDVVDHVPKTQLAVVEASSLN